MLEVNDVDGKRIKEGPNELDEIEILMEKELNAWENPQDKKPKFTNPRASFPITFEVFTFSTSKAQVDKLIE